MPSSVIRHAYYDAASRELKIEFTTGRHYLYLDVPGDVAAGFAAAFSKGRYFNARIRDHYDFEELVSAG